MLSALVIRDVAITIERLQRPELREVPLILLTGNKRLRVLAVDNLARDMGVEVGITQKQAELLCPTAIAFRAREDVYRRIFDNLTRSLSQKIGKIEALYHPRNALWYVPSAHAEELDLLRNLIQMELGLTATIGCASNKFVARVAAASIDHRFYKVRKGDEADFLAPYPISLLPLNKDMQRRLPMMGIQTIGQFALLSRAAVFEQWGKHGRWCHELAQGIDPRPLQSYQAAPVITQSVSFDEPILDKEILLASCVGLAPRMIHQLESQETRRIVLLLTDEDGSTHEAHLEPSVPIRDIFQLSRQLPSLLGKPSYTAGITGITLHFMDIAEVVPKQLSLFDFAQKKQSLDKALTEWQNRFHETVYQPILVDVPPLFPPELQVEYKVVSA